jgi:hypothetical protein
MGNPSNPKKSAQPDAKPSTQGRRLRVAKKRKKQDGNATIPENTVEPKVDTASLENELFESASELAKSKGYKVTRNSWAGSSMLVSRSIEVSDNQYIVDILPIGLHSGRGLIRYIDTRGGYLRVVEGQSDNVTELCNDLAEQSQRISAIQFQRDRHDGRVGNHNSPVSIVEGLESYYVNMLLGRVNYFKLRGKSVGFWANPVFLTSSRLEDQGENSTPWIPFPARSGKQKIDVVSATNLASYLDFREREVRILGRELLPNEEGLESFPSALRLFRTLTSCAAMLLLGGFFVFALNMTSGSYVASIALGLAALIEVLGGWKLFKGYRRLQKNNAIMQVGSPRITPGQVIKNEEEFLPDERAFLYWKYGGADLSKLRKEASQQRIEDLVNKSKEILSRTGKLENDELHSETVLSYDRATRRAMFAVVLSMGLETQSRELEEWFPHLRRVLENIKLEDIRYLKNLRDRVNRGYDASKDEAERAKEIATPLIADALQYLKNYPTKGDPQHHFPIPTTTKGTFTDPSTQQTQYYERLKNSVSTAYSAKDKSETGIFLHNLEKSVAAAACIKILQLTGEPPTALTSPDLLDQLKKSRAKPDQQQEAEEAQKWIKKLRDGEIQTDNDVKEFENHCISFLESMNIASRSKDAAPLTMNSNTTQLKPIAVSLSREPPENSAPSSGGGGERNQELEIAEPKMPKEILNPASTFKFLLGMTDDRELLDIGPGGAHLLEAKKELKNAKMSESGVVPERRKGRASHIESDNTTSETTKTASAAVTASAKFSDELDSITGSIDDASTRTDIGGDGETDSRQVISDLNSPMAKVSPFESLVDFKKVVAHCPFPVVASYLSDDEPSKEVENAMNHLAKKYHKRAAFISIDSKFRDIARESKIKSYPTVLVFHDGKMISELKSVDLDQLERDLSRLLESNSQISDEEDREKRLTEPKNDSLGRTETEQDGGIHKVGVADSP